MGKDEILDPLDHPRTMSEDLPKKQKLIFSLIFTFTAMMFFASCSSFRIIVLKDPLTPEEHLNLGVAYERKCELDQAIKEYKLAAKKLPLAHLYLGNAYFLKNELEEAESYYRKAIKKVPQNADAYNNLAWLNFTKRKNLDEAEKLALKAIELNPAKEHIYRDTLEKIIELKKLQQQ
jgi:tetratricopeptide (TPR) repeat protein